MKKALHPEQPSDLYTNPKLTRNAREVAAICKVFPLAFMRVVRGKGIQHLGLKNKYLFTVEHLNKFFGSNFATWAEVSILTVADMAQAIGLSETKTSHLIRDNAIQAVRIGKHRRFLPEHLRMIVAPQ